MLHWELVVEGTAKIITFTYMIVLAKLMMGMVVEVTGEKLILKTVHKFLCLYGVKNLLLPTEIQLMMNSSLIVAIYR